MEDSAPITPARDGHTVATMTDDRITAARTFWTAYAAGDTEELLSVLADDWTLHDADGTASGRTELADITDKHRVGFPEKQVEFLHELVDEGYIAQHVRLTLVHSGPYYDLEPTGKRVRLMEMFFHRMSGTRIEESWRMTWPEGVYALLTQDS
jgi:predicted ester cyclase